MLSFLLLMLLGWASQTYAGKCEAMGDQYTTVIQYTDNSDNTFKIEEGVVFFQLSNGAGGSVDMSKNTGSMTVQSSASCDDSEDYSVTVSMTCPSTSQMPAIISADVSGCKIQIDMLSYIPTANGNDNENNNNSGVTSAIVVAVVIPILFVVCIFLAIARLIYRSRQLRNRESRVTYASSAVVIPPATTTYVYPGQPQFYTHGTPRALSAAIELDTTSPPPPQYPPSVYAQQPQQQPQYPPSMYAQQQQQPQYPPSVYAQQPQPSYPPNESNAAQPFPHPLYAPASTSAPVPAPFSGESINNSNNDINSNNNNVQQFNASSVAPPALSPPENCIVCGYRPVEITLLDCMHSVSCSACATVLSSCPLCHSSVAGVLPLKRDA